MQTCVRCHSYAINPQNHGREDDVDLDLCDVCYWRKRAEEAKKYRCLCTLEGGRKIAQEWYSVDEITRRLAKANDPLGFEERIPEDIKSVEFAQWLTDEFRHAMMKGIQIAKQK